MMNCSGSSRNTVGLGGNRPLEKSGSKLLVVTPLTGRNQKHGRVWLAKRRGKQDRALEILIGPQ